MAVAAHGVPVRIIITKGTAADCGQTEKLIDGIKAKILLADRGYDSDAIVEKAGNAGMKAVIPPRKTVKSSESTTLNCTSYGIGLKILF